MTKLPVVFPPFSRVKTKAERQADSATAQASYQEREAAKMRALRSTQSIEDTLVQFVFALAEIDTVDGAGYAIGQVFDAANDAKRAIQARKEAEEL